MTQPTAIHIADLLDRHAGVLLDVYGVLFDARGPLPGAAALLAELDRRGTPFRIVTNDASRSQTTYAARFASHAITVAPERFVTSGSLLPAYIRTHGLVGARMLVLGTTDSVAFARAGGALALTLPAAAAGPRRLADTNTNDDTEPVGMPFVEGDDLDAIAVCDDDGFDFLRGVELALSAIVRAVEAGKSPALILPNPDLVYPKGGGELGFTAGAIALLLEAALARRFPGRALRFVHLGKPEPLLFTTAARQLELPPERLVMIGDQLETDIAGARAAGCACALLAGVSSWAHARETSTVVPDFLLDALT
ncbi:MAG: HAD-IIA family hydrolase [Kofleriaceae bacterium]